MADESDSGISSALQSVTRGAGAQFLGLGTRRGLAFITTFLLTRALGTNLYGIYSLGKTVMGIASTLTNLGTNQAITRFVPQYDDRTIQNRVIGLASLTSLIASVAVGATLYVSAPLLTRLTLNQPLLTDVFRVFALTLPFQTLNGCVSSAFRSIELPGYQVLTSDVGRQVFRLIMVAIAVAIGASLVGFIAAMVVAWVLTFFFGVGLLLSRTDFRPQLKGTQPGIREFFDFSVPLSLSDMGSLLQNKVDILMVGIFLPGSAVGIYNISAILSQALTIPLIGFNTMFPPIAARMYSKGKLADLEALFTRVTRWSFTLSLLPSIGLIVYSSEALSIFGQDFTAGSGVLSLFVVANLTNAAVGPSNYVLMMSDHQYLTMINEWTLGISNVIFNYLLITQFGLIGAALASAGILAFINIVRLVEVWYTERLFPYSFKYIKPIIAGFLSGSVMVGWQVFSPLSGIVLLVTGATTGTVVFCLTLLVMGIESEDREFFREILL